MQQQVHQEMGLNQRAISKINVDGLVHPDQAYHGRFVLNEAGNIADTNSTLATFNGFKLHKIKSCH